MATGTFPPESYRPPGNRTCIPFRLLSREVPQAQRITAKKIRTRSHYLFWVSCQHDLSRFRHGIAVCFWDSDSAMTGWSQELAMFQVSSNFSWIQTWGFRQLVLPKEYLGRLHMLGIKFTEQQVGYPTLLLCRRCRFGTRVVFCRQSAICPVHGMMSNLLLTDFFVLTA